MNCHAKVGNPTPVGIYPAGAAPAGHLDMAGNVWEWIRDPYEELDTHMVIRGGSWDSDAQLCRSVLRNDNWPVVHRNSLGFRLSRSLDPECKEG